MRRSHHGATALPVGCDGDCQPVCPVAIQAVQRLVEKDDIRVGHQHTGEFETQLTLIAAGLGVAVIPRLARPRELPAGVRVVRMTPAPRRRVVIAWREASAARPAIKAAEQALRDAWARSEAG